MDSIRINLRRMAVETDLHEISSFALEILCAEFPEISQGAERILRRRKEDFDFDSANAFLKTNVKAGRLASLKDLFNHACADQDWEATKPKMDGHVLRLATRSLVMDQPIWAVGLQNFEEMAAMDVVRKKYIEGNFVPKTARNMTMVEFERSICRNS